MNRPGKTAGMRHLALNVANLDACRHFYVDLLGMEVEWNPDPDNFYLSSGNDNLALHKSNEAFAPKQQQHLDHLGFILQTPEEVQHWYNFLNDQKVKMHSQLCHHRDGAVSFYCEDPDGNKVQIMYHPPISAK